MRLDYEAKPVRWEPLDVREIRVQRDNLETLDRKVRLEYPE